MPQIGYARVSTEDQNARQQITALQDAGCATIFTETASGASRARPELSRALRHLAKADVLVVVRIDRLARSLSHLLSIIDDLEARSIGFRSLSDDIDTTTPQGKFALQILGAVSEFERALIAERTKSGLRRAATEGRKGGNPGLASGDKATLRALAQARDMARTDALIEIAGTFLPTVKRLRPATTWDRIALVLKAQGARRPDGKDWTRDSLIRACKRLSRDGLIDKSLLKRTPRGPEAPALTDLVAALYTALPNPTLQAIARQLETQHIRTPRGGMRWSTSSVQNLLTRAKSEGLIPR